MFVIAKVACRENKVIKDNDLKKEEVRKRLKKS
jgi:hypothetical protein